MGILEDWKRQCEEDKENQNHDLPQCACGDENGVSFDEDAQKRYEEELDRQRNSPLDMENVFQSRMDAMVKVSDRELQENAVFEKVEVSVMHAYCPKCGREIVNKAPTMYNPFTAEKSCVYRCEDCGTEYNFEQAYPRIVLRNENGEEVFAHND